MLVNLCEIVKHPSCQLRPRLDEAQVLNLMEAIERGDVLPPVQIVRDGKLFFLAHGYHRAESYTRLNHEAIECEVTLGTLRDAQLIAAAANGEEQSPRCKQTKRNQVRSLLVDPEWSAWSDNAIAKHCKVSRSLVSEVRREVSEGLPVDQQVAAIVYERKGKKLAMSKQNIGNFKFNQVKELYDGLVPNAFQRKILGGGYAFAYNNTDASRFSYSCVFPTLDAAFEQFPVVEAKFLELKQAYETFKLRSGPEPIRKTCKVCTHRRLIEDGSSFTCDAKADDGSSYLISEDPGLDGCRLFKEYSSLSTPKPALPAAAKQIPAIASIAMPEYSPTDLRGQEKAAIALNLPSMAPFPSKQYKLIAIDPPWRYGLREDDQTHRGRTPYPTMSDQEILSLNVGGIAAADSYILLWTTNNHLPLAFECLEYWGFEYKSIHTWLKITSSGSIRMGVGHYGRNSTEHFLVGMRGNPGSWTKLGLTNIPNSFLAATGEHSVKPSAFFTVADRLANELGGDRIELFARERRSGWDAWGLEAPEVQGAGS